MVKRAKGNARAAANQTDTTDVVVNVITKVKTGVSGYKFDNEFVYSGVQAINIYELLRRSEFFKCYAPMYDQFRVTSIKVKVIPLAWKLYNQFNLPNVTYGTAVSKDKTGINESSSINNGVSGDPLLPNESTYADLSPVRNGNGDPVNGEVGTFLTKKKVNGLENEYLYPQCLTIVTAWDRTGLDTVQYGKCPVDYRENNQDKWGIPPNNDDIKYAIKIGDDISTYSSAKSTQLIAGANFNCTRYLYPSSQIEKS